MKSGLMFHPLESYLDKEYLNSHNTIILDTPDGSRSFRVFAVVKEKISRENSFNYNMFTHFDTQKPKRNLLSKPEPLRYMWAPSVWTLGRVEKCIKVIPQDVIIGEKGKGETSDESRAV